MFDHNSAKNVRIHDDETNQRIRDALALVRMLPSEYGLVDMASVCGWLDQNPQPDARVVKRLLLAADLRFEADTHLQEWFLLQTGHVTIEELDALDRNKEGAELQ